MVLRTHEVNQLSVQNPTAVIICGCIGCLSAFSTVVVLRLRVIGVIVGWHHLTLLELLHHKHHLLLLAARVSGRGEAGEFAQTILV